MPKHDLPEIPVRFYRTSSGREPTLDWLRARDKEGRRIVGINLMRVQFGWPVGMPTGTRPHGWPLGNPIQSRGACGSRVYCFVFTRRRSWCPTAS